MTMRLQRNDPANLGSILAIRRSGRRYRLWGVSFVVMLGAAGLSAVSHDTAGPQSVNRSPPAGRAAVATPSRTSAECGRPHASLQHSLDEIARSFEGTVGIAVARVGCDWIAGTRLSELFPQQSVSKLWVSLAVFDAIDAGELRPDLQLTIRPEDLTVFNQPLRKAVLDNGLVNMTVDELMTAALSRSDNTANDRLLRAVGGSDAVRALLQRKRIEGIRFGPGERLMQSSIAGLEWQPSYSLGRNFYEARDRLPMAVRKAAFDHYLADPVDGATPAGIVRALARLVNGELLSPASTLALMGILGRTHSGPMRLKAGVPPDWRVFHKTGTGQELGRTATGYNDVGILEAPDGAFYAVAAMIRETREPIPVRMRMMQAVSEAVVRFHEPDRVLPPRPPLPREDARTD